MVAFLLLCYFLIQVTRTLNQNENIAPFLLGRQSKVCLDQLRMKFEHDKSISFYRKMNNPTS